MGQRSNGKGEAIAPRRVRYPNPSRARRSPLETSPEAELLIGPIQDLQEKGGRSANLNFDETLSREDEFQGRLEGRGAGRRQMQ